MSESLYMEPTELLRVMDNPIAFPTQTRNTMHLHQAPRQPDKVKFLKAMVREVQIHKRRKHWKLIPVTSVQMGVQILDSIWEM